jgi:ceramide glucosyltransferase
MSAWEIWQLLCGLLLVASFGYWGLAWHSLRRWQPHLLEMDDGNAPSVPAWPTVSLLKPLHGADPTLADLVLAAVRHLKIIKKIRDKKIYKIKGKQK